MTTRNRLGQFERSESFMQLQIVRKGKLASCDCVKCGMTNYWHEWVDDGQLDVFKSSRCHECGAALDPDTFWESAKRNQYAARYSAPGYLDCTYWHYGPNARKLLREVREFYGAG